MKIPKLLVTAGLMVAALGVSTGANAQRHDGNRNDHRGDRRHHVDRGRHNGWNHAPRCRTEWRHHHRVRICR